MRVRDATPRAREPEITEEPERDFKNAQHSQIGKARKRHSEVAGTVVHLFNPSTGEAEAG